MRRPNGRPAASASNPRSPTAGPSCRGPWSTSPSACPRGAYATDTSSFADPVVGSDGTHGPRAGGRRHWRPSATGNRRHRRPDGPVGTSAARADENISAADGDLSPERGAGRDARVASDGRQIFPRTVPVWRYAYAEPAQPERAAAADGARPGLEHAQSRGCVRHDGDTGLAAART